MELFNPLRNSQFTALEQVLQMLESHEMVNYKGLISLLHDAGFTYVDLVNALLAEKANYADAIMVLEKTSDGKYHSLLNHPVRAMPLNFEISWLTYMLKHTPDGLLMDTQLKTKLLDCLAPLHQNFELKHIYQHRESQGTNLSERQIHWLNMICKAIHKNQCIQYIYQPKNNEQQIKKIGQPFKIEYSNSDCRFWLILYDIEANRFIKTILSRYEDIALLEVPGPLSYDTMLSQIETYLADEYLIVEVSGETHAIDRFFHFFSNFKKIAVKKSDDKNTFQVTMQYYHFDRGDILKRILQMGPAAKLVRPISLQNELIHRLDKAIQNYAEECFSYE